MHFSVIYSFDVPCDTSVKPYQPPSDQRKLWNQTEGDSQYDYDYLGGVWSKGKHRKYCAVLDKAQFQAFVDHCYLCAEDVETMGSIGAPGCGFGCSPAISFNMESQDCIGTAYVTPIPSSWWLGKREPSKDEATSERRWQCIRKAIIRQYR